MEISPMDVQGRNSQVRSTGACQLSTMASDSSTGSTKYQVPQGKKWVVDLETGQIKLTESNSG